MFNARNYNVRDAQKIIKPILSHICLLKLNGFQTVWSPLNDSTKIVTVVAQVFKLNYLSNTAELKAAKAERDKSYNTGSEDTQLHKILRSNN